MQEALDEALLKKEVESWGRLQSDCNGGMLQFFPSGAPSIFTFLHQRGFALREVSGEQDPFGSSTCKSDSSALLPQLPCLTCRVEGISGEWVW